MSHSRMNRIADGLLGLCFLVSMSCAAAPFASLAAGSAMAAKQSQQSQSGAARQNANVQNKAANNRAGTDKADADKKKVLAARSRADADPKSPGAVDGYAKAVLDSDQALRRDPDKSFNWGEQAGHAADLTSKVASDVPDAQKKAHFYTQTGLLFARLDQSDGAIAAFESSLKADPADLAVVESLLGLYEKSDATGGASETLCKRTSHSLKGEAKTFQLYDLCVKMHPKRSQYSMPADLDKMLPWVSGKELKQYKRSVIVLETVTDPAMGYEMKMPKGAKVLQKEDANHTYSLPLPGGLNELNVSLSSAQPDELANMARLKRNFNQITVQSEKDVDGGKLMVSAPGDLGIQYVMYSKPGKSTGILVTCAGPKGKEALLTEMCSSLKVTK